jgi:RNA polymerase sigma-70 factor (sigma-E family)
MTTSGRGGGSSRDDELLSRLYQQVTEQQAARFGGEYDIAAGLDRYQIWLCDHAAADQASQAAMVRALLVSRAGIGSASAAPALGEAVTASEALPGHAGARSEIGAVKAGWDAGRAVTALYSLHYESLVGLAVLLVRDVPTAEEVVQDSFVQLHAAWRGVADSDRALSHLRRQVVQRCRSVLRRRVVADKPAPPTAPGHPAAVPEPISRLERSAEVAALRALPPRQREVLVLRYYADLSEAQIASAMGISKAAVKNHTARAMSSLQAGIRQAKGQRNAVKRNPSTHRDLPA